MVNVAINAKCVQTSTPYDFKPQKSLKFAAHDTGITGRVLRDGFPHPGKSRKRMDDIDPIKV